MSIQNKSNGLNIHSSTIDCTDRLYVCIYFSIAECEPKNMSCFRSVISMNACLSPALWTATTKISSLYGHLRQKAQPCHHEQSLLVSFTNTAGPQTTVLNAPSSDYSEAEQTIVTMISSTRYYNTSFACTRTHIHVSTYRLLALRRFALSQSKTMSFLTQRLTSLFYRLHWRLPVAS